MLLRGGGIDEGLIYRCDHSDGPIPGRLGLGVRIQVSTWGETGGGHELDRATKYEPVSSWHELLGTKLRVRANFVARLPHLEADSAAAPLLSRTPSRSSGERQPHAQSLERLLQNCFAA